MTEVAGRGSARSRAERALDAITLLPGEAWYAAAHRLVLHARAAKADATQHATRPHVSEEVYFWRYLEERGLNDLCNPALCLFLPGAADQLSMEMALYTPAVQAKQFLRPISPNMSNRTSAAMAHRGAVAQAIFTEFIDFLYLRDSNKEMTYGRPERPTTRMASVESLKKSFKKRSGKTDLLDLVSVLFTMPG